MTEITETDQSVDRDGDWRTRPVKHPAKFSDEIVTVLDRLIRAEQRRLGRPVLVYDPFAGVGRVHRLAVERGGDRIVQTVGSEIQASWASLHDRTIHADSLRLMRRWADHRHLVVEVADLIGVDPLRVFDGFDVVATSPCYGNRFADKHDAQDGSTRRSYAHDLRAMGDDLAPDSAGGLAWGPAYWQFHAEAYRLIRGVLRPPSDADPSGGLLLLNVSDFVKAKAIVPAALWHRGAAHGAGFIEIGERPRFVETPRMTYGENSDRAPSEVVYRLRPAA